MGEGYQIPEVMSSDDPKLTTRNHPVVLGIIQTKLAQGKPALAYPDMRRDRVAHEPLHADLKKKLEDTQEKLRVEAWVNVRYEPISEFCDQWSEEYGAKLGWSEVLTENVGSNLSVGLNRLHKEFWENAAEFAAAEAGCGG